MKRSKIQKYEMLARVAEFGAMNASLFPKKTAAVDLVKDLQAVVEKMSSARAAQSADQLRTSMLQKLEKHETLLRQLKTIYQTAAALNIDGFAIPYRPSSPRLCDIARHTIDAAEPLKAQFVLHGLPSDFIETLKQAAAELRAAIESRVAARDRCRTAAEEFDQALDEGLKCQQRLKVLASNTMSGDPSVMAAWEVARRLDPIRSSRKTAAPVTDQPPPLPATPVAVNTAA
jgi:hypothetical protein